MYKYLLDLIGLNADKPLVDYKDCKTKYCEHFSKPYINQTEGSLSGSQNRLCLHLHLLNSASKLTVDWGENLSTRTHSFGYSFHLSELNNMIMLIIVHSDG